MKFKRCFILLPFLVSATVAFGAPESASLRMPGLESFSLHDAQFINALDPHKVITFTVWLKSRSSAELDTLISDLYNPYSPRYQQFLTLEEFERHFAPSAQALETVQHYFNRHGMHAERSYSNVHVTASAQQIEQLFQVKMNNYRYHNKVRYSNDSAPAVSNDIAAYVSGISGLSTIPSARPQHRTALKKSVDDSWRSEPIRMLWDSFVPTVTPTTTSFQGFTGAQLRMTYQLASVAPVNGTVIDGSGQTIVIIDGCGHASTADIMTYANQYNIANSLPLLNSSNFAVVKKDGSPYTGICSNPSGWDGEIMLDVQASHTIAPGANIVVVLTDNVDNSDVADAINYIISNGFSIGGFANAYVVSNSWDNTYEQPNEPLDATLAFAATQGLSINFAAGDCGDQTYNSSWTCSKLSNTPSVQYPVSSAYVTAVSGTSLFVDSNWSYAFESGWGTLVNGSFYSGSMGGMSQYRSAPSWQSSISTFTAGGYAGTVGQYGTRALPDIAMLADLYTGLLTYSNGCQPCYYGGASLATPLFSGVVTLVNQARTVLAGGAPNPLGLAAPYFYTSNLALIQAKAINLITPPHQIVSGARPVTGGPVSAFKIWDTAFAQEVTFNWDSALTINENQFWNDVVGVGSPNIPNFVQKMALL